LREIILENLAEERDPASPHPKLWRDFAAAGGVTDELPGSPLENRFANYLPTFEQPNT